MNGNLQGFRSLVLCSITQTDEKFAWPYTHIVKWKNIVDITTQYGKTFILNTFQNELFTIRGYLCPYIE